MTCTVAFTVDGTQYSISGLSQVTIGNRYRNCYANVDGNDDQLAAMVPLEAVGYAVHDQLTVTTGSVDSVSIASQSAD
ncbi:MAG: hypothetical protein ABEJ59_03975 [Halanaeroarchaeum sp.]